MVADTVDELIEQESVKDIEVRDEASRVAIIFMNPENQQHIAVSIPWLLTNGIPHNEQSVPYIYRAVHLVQ